MVVLCQADAEFSNVTPWSRLVNVIMYFYCKVGGYSSMPSEYICLWLSSWGEGVGTKSRAY